MPSLEQPSAEKRRQILGHLPRKQLQHLADLYNLEVDDRRKRSLYIEALIAADIDFYILLGILGPEDLKQLTKALRVRPAGEDKQQLIDAVLASEAPAGSAGVQPAADQLTLPEDAAARTKAKKKLRKAKRSVAAPERSNHAELLRQLWEAAVHLRGSIEPADYKRYVLPIIFLRFLSVRFEQRRIELADEVREPASPYYAESEEEAAFVLEDDDSYRSANVFPVPAAARWEEIRKHAQADDVKIRMDRALEALEEAYPLKLKGLLPRVFAGSNLSRENVTGLINLFSRDVFSADHGGADMLGQVYEYFIGEFADSEGKRGGEYFTPVSIVRTYRLCSTGTSRNGWNHKRGRSGPNRLGAVQRDFSRCRRSSRAGICRGSRSIERSAPRQCPLTPFQDWRCRRLHAGGSAA